MLQIDIFWNSSQTNLYDLRRDFWGYVTMSMSQMMWDWDYESKLQLTSHGLATIWRKKLQKIEVFLVVL